MSNPQNGAIGVVITLTVRDQDGALMHLTDPGKIRLERPDNTTVDKDAIFPSGIDYQIKYTTIANDLNQTGIWKLQALIIVPQGGFSGPSSRFTMLVEKNAGE